MLYEHWGGSPCYLKSKNELYVTGDQVENESQILKYEIDNDE